MPQLINEAKRMQLLAGLITESQLKLNELSSEEQEITNTILGKNINEGIDIRAIMSKLFTAAKKGILTLAILGSVLSSCNLDNDTHQKIEDTIKNKYSLTDTTKLKQLKQEATEEYNKTLEDIQEAEFASMTSPYKGLEKEKADIGRDKASQLQKDIEKIDSTINAQRTNEALKEYRKQK